MKVLDGGVGGQDPEAVGILTGYGPVPLLHPLVKCGLLTLEAVLLPGGSSSPVAVLSPSQPLPHIPEIQQDGQVRRPSQGCLGIQRQYEVAIDPPPVSLIGYGGVGEAVADDDPVRVESRKYGLRHVLDAVRHVQKELRHRSEVAVSDPEEDATQLLAEFRPSRFAGDDDSSAIASEGLSEKSGLSALACPLGPFKGDEKTLSHRASSLPGALAFVAGGLFGCVPEHRL